MAGFVRTRLRALAPVALAILAGCASFPPESAILDDDAQAVEIADTPFFAQERYQCGPAALTTLLVHSGVQTTLESIVDQVYIPSQQGSLQTELLAATRANSRIPYPIDPTLSSIYTQLTAGRPVLILQNLGIRPLPRWHYAVVVGIDPELRSVYLRSGTERRHEVRLRTFLRTWQRSNFWAFVALRPGELPGNPDAMRFLEAVSAVESTGHEAAAYPGWQAAVAYWPENVIAIFGLANAEYALNHFAKAENLYRRILEIDANHLFARNNLALALAQQGRGDEAIEQVRLALRAVNPDSELVAELEATLAQVQTMANARNRKP